MRRREIFSALEFTGLSFSPKFLIFRSGIVFAMFDDQREFFVMRSTPQKSDEQIKHQIERELNRDTGIRDLDINVEWRTRL